MISIESQSKDKVDRLYPPDREGGVSVRLLLGAYPCQMAFTLQDVSLTKDEVVGFLISPELNEEDLGWLFASRSLRLQLERPFCPNEEELKLLSAQLTGKHQTGKGWELKFQLQ
ncbi:MAG: hypothetical protein KA436_07920 [Oligoflexales bacterium]|nr:hypothetical protein [Oligoflexales bacterium]